MIKGKDLKKTRLSWIIWVGPNHTTQTLKAEVSLAGVRHAAGKMRRGQSERFQVGGLGVLRGPGSRTEDPLGAEGDSS